MMADSLQRMSDIINQEFNRAAEAQSVVIKGFDGSNYPALKVSDGGSLVEEKPNVTFTWVAGKPTTIVSVYSDRTETMTLAWDGDELDTITMS
jgi:hypothetical protein